MIFPQLALLGISLASALVPKPVSLRTLPSLPNLANIPVSLEQSEGSWNSSDVSETPPLSENVTKSSVLLVNRSIQWQCGHQWGGGPYAGSCFDAIRNMVFTPGSPTQQLCWGDREGGEYDVPLWVVQSPYFLSDAQFGMVNTIGDLVTPSLHPSYFAITISEISC